jgi:hypothetical protein
MSMRGASAAEPEVEESLDAAALCAGLAGFGCLVPAVFAERSALDAGDEAGRASATGAWMELA